MLAFVLLAAAGAAGWGEGDLAVIRSARRGVAVRITSRPAIIGWNGTDEVMILGTGLSADGEATVLLAFPLPDVPSRIAPAKRESLWAVDRMVAEEPLRRRADGGGGALFPPGNPPAAEIARHDPVPVRDRAVITVKDADGFLTEATALATRQGGRLSSADGAALRAMAARYLGIGYHHFALEAVDLKRGSYTVGPTNYQFRSERLFFPNPSMVPSTPPRGLRFFVFTRLEPQQQALSLWLKLLSSAGAPLIRFPVKRDDARRISRAVANLFSKSDEMVLTAVAPDPTQDLVPREQPPAGTAGEGDGLSAVRGAPRPSGPVVVIGLGWSPAGDRLCVVESRIGGDGKPVATAAVLDLVKGARKEVPVSGWLSPQGWSPDGKQIGFLDDTGRIRVVDVDRDRARQVTGSPCDFVSARADQVPAGWSPPAWSASGQWLAFGACGDVWVVRPDGRELRQVTRGAGTEEASGLGAGDSGRREVARGAAASSSGRSGRGGGGGRGGQTPLPHPYAWSPRGDVLAYGEADAEHVDWSVQGYEPGAGRAASVRGGLGLKRAGALSWHPGGGQLALVGFGPMAKQTVYLIPRQGAIRGLTTTLTSVEVMWTGDGRTLLIRGAAHGTQRLTVNTVEAEGGTVRTLPPTHFLADREVTLVAARPGTNEIAFARDANVYLARADGSQWRRLNRDGPVTMVEMANPMERWQRDPVVLEAARRWRRAVPRGSAGDEGKLVYGIWDDFLARWKARLLAGEWVSYRDLPADQQREVLTGLVYQTFRSAPIGGDPGAVTVPGWYWWLKDARLGLVQPDASRLLLTLEGPDDAATAFVISSPRSAGRRARNTLLHFWWPALFGAAAVIVALLGWRQRRRERDAAV
jgi:hypothetical protein